MSSTLKCRPRLGGLYVSLCLLLAGAGHALAQPAPALTALHSFTRTNGPGVYPYASVVMDTNGMLYGTTYQGGAADYGAVFRVRSDGTGLTALWTFTNYPDGAHPQGGLVLSGGTLYGTTDDGGSYGAGTIFKINTNGTGYTNVYTFNYSPDGGYPVGGLLLSGSTLYGTASAGGTNYNGTVFKINTNGSGYTVLWTFTNYPDGMQPNGDLLLSGSTLYGTTTSGGSTNAGTVFKVNTNGSGYAVLWSFTNSPDGANPYGGLALSGGTLYGTTANGGSNLYYGTIFAIGTNGLGYTSLKSFNYYPDGAYPYSSLLLLGSLLYGTTGSGGTNGYGTVFSINLNGSGYNELRSFSNSPDASSPYRGILALSGSTLYGTTEYGGSSRLGTVFKVDTNGGGYAVLTNFTGLTDGSYPNLAGVAVSGNSVYGVTANGGTADLGTLYKVNADGSGYAVLKSFTNSPDGATPQRGLLLSGDTLYGTTPSGGSNYNGTVYKINTNGLGYSVLWNFTNYPDGNDPYCELVISGGTLYGTTAGGGTNYDGTVFSIGTNGSGYTVLRSFTNNPDGHSPYGGLVSSGSVLYGITTYGGITNAGTIFKINTNGSGYAVLWNFTNSPDGAYPFGRLVLSGGALYGTTYGGGASSYGTVFSISTNGSQYTVLRSFTNYPDGRSPYGGLLLSGGVLYGTTAFGGDGGGTLFQLNTDGTGYTVLTNMDGPGGYYIYAGLAMSGCSLFGAANYGGSYDYGTTFRFDLGSNTPLAAVPLSGHTYSTPASIAFPGALNCYSFTVPTNPATRAWIYVDTGGPQDPTATSRDSLLSVLSADGITAVETDDDDGIGNGLGSTIQSFEASAIAGLPLTNAGTYSIKVSAANGVGIVFPYTLYAAITSNNPTMASEPDNTPTNANPILATNSDLGYYLGSIASSADQDFYSVVAEAGNILYINADGDPLRTGIGTPLQVDFLSTDGRTVLLSTPPAYGWPPPPARAFCYKVPATGTYYVSVASDTPGSYGLMVTRSAPGQFTFSSGASGPGGLVYQSPVSPYRPAYYTSNSLITLVALPRAGFAFSGWSGSAGGMANPLSVLVKSNMTISGNFTSTVPDLIIDNTNATGFAVNGFWTLGMAAPNYYGANYRYISAGGNPSLNATFTPGISVAGNYDVAAWWPQAVDGGSALYSLAYSGGTSNVTVTQANASGGQFYPLYSGLSFSNGTGGHLTVSSATAQAGLSIYADAARWRWSVNQKLIPVFGGVSRLGTNILLNWYGETGSVYRVQYKTNLNPAILWNDLSGDVLASGSTPVVIAGKTNSVVGAGPQRFYRVLALP